MKANSKSSSFIIGIKNLRANTLSVLADKIIKADNPILATGPTYLVNEFLLEEWKEEDRFDVEYEARNLMEQKYIVFYKKIGEHDTIKDVLYEIENLTDDVVIVEV